MRAARRTGESEQVQGNAHVGDGAAGGNDGRIDQGQPSRAKPVLARADTREPGDDVETEMPADDDGALCAFCH